jgi:hypothetical protein
MEHMTLRALMQAGPAKANELFTRLGETSSTAVKTRERLFAELKAELEQHATLEERHLFPILRKHPETKEIVTALSRDNKHLRAKLEELDSLPKNDEAFPGKLAELRKAFRQHARDEKREFLPAVQDALSEAQIQNVTEKMEASLSEADQAKQEQAAEKRAAARLEREERKRAELSARQTQAAEPEREDEIGRAEEAIGETAATTSKATKPAAKLATKVADTAAQATNATVAVVAEGNRELTNAVTDSAQHATANAVEAARETAATTSKAAKAAAKVTAEVADTAAQATNAAVAAAAEEARELTRAVTDGSRHATANAVEATAAVTSAMPRTGFILWDMMLAMWDVRPSRAGAPGEAE